MPQKGNTLTSNKKEHVTSPQFLDCDVNIRRNGFTLTGNIRKIMGGEVEKYMWFLFKVRVFPFAAQSNKLMTVVSSKFGP